MDDQDAKIDDLVLDDGSLGSDDTQHVTAEQLRIFTNGAYGMSTLNLDSGYSVASK